MLLLNPEVTNPATGLVTYDYIFRKMHYDTATLNSATGKSYSYNTISLSQDMPAT